RVTALAAALALGLETGRALDGLDLVAGLADLDHGVWRIVGRTGVVVPAAGAATAPTAARTGRARGAGLPVLAVALAPGGVVLGGVGAGVLALGGALCGVAVDGGVVVPAAAAASSPAPATAAAPGAAPRAVGGAALVVLALVLGALGVVLGGGGGGVVPGRLGGAGLSLRGAARAAAARAGRGLPAVLRFLLLLGRVGVVARVGGRGGGVRG